MPDDVNQNLPPRPQARTRLARRAVIDAARQLFIENGYAMTTVAAISRRADVPEPTIYRLFSSKVGILKVLLDVSIAGDDEPVAVADRPDVGALLRAGDPGDVLAGFAAITTQINERTNDLYTVLRRQRDHGQAQIVNALHRTHRLRTGLTAAAAADIVHALMSPEVYRLLVIERRWTPARYERWAAELLIQQLI